MDIHKLPRPEKGFVLPSHRYTGPYNPLHKQLDAHDNPLPGQEPFNAVDQISMNHDICYRDKHSKQYCDDHVKRIRSTQSKRSKRKNRQKGCSKHYQP